MYKKIWKPITGYEGSYEVSDQGEVKSCSRVLKNGLKGKHLSNEILLKKVIINGYYKVTLYKNNRAKSFYVHRLVAATFIDNNLNKGFVNHKDGNKLNNNVENLVWSNQRENTVHAVEIGLIPKFYISCDCLKKLYVDDKMSISSIANSCEVSPSTISKKLNEYGIIKRTASEQAKLRKY